jgi:hypothetical protein
MRCRSLSRITVIDGSRRPACQFGRASRSPPTARGYAPASACRPTSVILSHVTLFGRPPACTVPGVAFASPVAHQVD